MDVRALLPSFFGDNYIWPSSSCRIAWGLGTSLGDRRLYSGVHKAGSLGIGSYTTRADHVCYLLLTSARCKLNRNMYFMTWFKLRDGALENDGSGGEKNKNKISSKANILETKLPHGVNSQKKTPVAVKRKNSCKADGVGKKSRRASQKVPFLQLFSNGTSYMVQIVRENSIFRQTLRNNL